MASRKKKSRCLGFRIGSDSDSDSDRDRDSGSDSARAKKKIRKRKRSKEINYSELKDMRKLESNDEAFVLSWREIDDITDIIRSRKTPAPKTFGIWDKYEASFYLKMCTCFGVNYQHLEAASELENDKKQLLTASESNIEPSQPLLDKIELRMERPSVELFLKAQCLGKERECLEEKLRLECPDVELSLKAQLLAKERECLEEKLRMECLDMAPAELLYLSATARLLASRRDRLEEEMRMECTGVELSLMAQLLAKERECLEEVLFILNTQYFEREMERVKEEFDCTSLEPIRGEPLETGVYLSGEEPKRVPYHLYLLLKEAVDIMKCNDDIELKRVEEKIRFFCTYFYSHLPPGWKYKRDSASSLVFDYDPMTKPKYVMTGYMPHLKLDEDKNDTDTRLTEQEMADIMSIVHSRKTPTFMEMTWMEISFYCKLCSCFKIAYHRLEDASEDDVCLMNMGRNG